MDMFDIFLVLTLALTAGAFILAIVFYALVRLFNHLEEKKADELQPLLGVVLPKEDKDA